MDLSIIIPAMNEGRNVSELIHKIKIILNTLNISFEILVIDARSFDGTPEYAEAAGAKVFFQDKPGYGGALQKGFANAQGEIIITMDADLSHEPVFIKKLYENRNEADVLIASRYVDGGSAEMSKYRYFLSLILNQVYTKALNLPFKDISSGFRLYRKNDLENIEINSTNYDVLQEVLILLFSKGCKIKEIPFHYAPRKDGKTHIKLFKFAISYIETLYRMWKLRNSLLCADYDCRAYDSIIPLQRYWQRKRFSKVMEFIGGVDATVLDIGCGSSRIIQTLKNAVGIDIRMNILQWLNNGTKKLANASIFQLPFKNNSFETVLCSQVIEHIPKDEIIFKEFSRVIKKNGTLILGTPDYSKRSWNVIEWFYGKILPNAYADEHISHYSLKELAKILKKHGFKIRDYYYILEGELIIKARKK